VDGADPRYIAWYRPAVMARLVKIGVTSALCTSLGMALLGLALWSGRLVEAARLPVALLGGAGVLAGPLSLVLRWHRVLVREDGCLALRRDGLDIQLPPAPHRFVPWDDLVDARVGDGGAIELALRGGERLRLVQDFTGETRAGVARAIETTRKRAGLGLLRP
jgi:hypothetical protein